MSSILTNTSAMVALQTLQGINKDLASTQSQISTGKRIDTAKDNAATWAISKVMESDVSAFNAIRENLALGSSTVNVARNAAETVTDLLTQIKEKVIQAQEENVDREKIQSDIDALRNQIESVTGAAQFNGLSLVNNFRTETVLSSLDRSGDGVTPGRIDVDAQDLTTRQEVFGTAGSRTGQAEFDTASGNLDAAATQTITVSAFSAGTATFSVGGVQVSFEAETDADTTAANLLAAIQASTELADLGVTAVAGANSDEVDLTFAGEARFGVTTSVSGPSTYGGIGTVAASSTSLTLDSEDIQDGDSYRVTLGTDTFEFVANERSTARDVLTGLAEAIDESSAFVARFNTAGALEIAEVADAQPAFTTEEFSGGTSAGGLEALADLEVADFTGLPGFSTMTAQDQRAAILADLASSLTDIENLIQTSINAAAEFGSVQGRIEIQEEFVSNLTDSLKTGIGSLVDTDMEEASAKLQALQVQQQLGVQALSIANQAPQTILALFQ